MNHERHQYYFEKYLRNEMSDADKKQLEERLSEDISLRKSFNEYRNNRASYLEQSVKAHESSLLYSKVSSIIYLTISITGIALAANYYIDNQQLKATNETLEIKTKPKDRKLWDKLPVFGSEFKEDANKQIAVISQPEPIELPATKEDTKVETLSAKISSSPAADKVQTANFIGNKITSDILLLDTFLAPIEKEMYELRFRVVKGYNEDGSEAPINDSITDLTYSRISESKLHKENPVLVEFWKSPVKYKGYSFNGKKLVLYGIDSPYAINLYKVRNNIVLKVLYDTTSLTLIKDNEFHKF